MRIPADYVHQIGIKEGYRLEPHSGADGALSLRPVQWNRKAFAQDLARYIQALHIGSSVVAQLRDEARY